MSMPERATAKRTISVTIVTKRDIGLEIVVTTDLAPTGSHHHHVIHPVPFLVLPRLVEDSALGVVAVVIVAGAVVQIVGMVGTIKVAAIATIVIVVEVMIAAVVVAVIDVAVMGGDVVVVTVAVGAIM